MREIFGHVIHPVQIAANTVKKSAQHNGEKITKDEFVFLVKKAGDAKCGKGKKVIAADLHGTQYISAVLEKL